jgi:hypothetical protein
VTVVAAVVGVGTSAAVSVIASTVLTRFIVTAFACVAIASIVLARFIAAGAAFVCAAIAAPLALVSS